MTTTSFDAVVIGAGIAGLAVAAELAQNRSVLVIEDQPAHATQSSARSASSWIPRYGADAVGPLTIASRAWYETGGGGYADRSLLAPRATLVVSADADSVGLTAAIESGMEPIDGAAARALYPALRDGVVAAGAVDPLSADIDTPVAIKAYVSHLEHAGGQVWAGTTTHTIERAGGAWTMRTSKGAVVTDLIVDAAGAWADQVARLAGVAPLGLRALRRTACLVEPRSSGDLAALPLLMEADEAFYLKPESGALLASPADEIEQPPGPAVPTDADVEAGLEQVRIHTDLAPLEPVRRWAGLRTFVSDRTPVLGPDPLVPGWAWSVGFGGIGIMTAPAAARTVVSLVDEGRLPHDVAAAGGRREALVADRLATRR